MCVATVRGPQVNLRLKKKNKLNYFQSCQVCFIFGLVSSKPNGGTASAAGNTSQHDPEWKGEFVDLSAVAALLLLLLCCLSCCCCLFAGLLLARNSTFWLPAKCCECPQCMPLHSSSPSPARCHPIPLFRSPCRINLVFSTSTHI